MLNWIGNLKLKNKIALACIGLISLSSLFSAVLLYSYVAAQIRETADVNSADMMAQVSNFLDEKLKEILRRAYALQINDSFHKTLTDFLFNEEKYRYPMALSRLSGSFAEIRSTERLISSIFLYTPKGEFFDLAKIKNAGFNFENARLFQELQRIPDQSVFWGLSGKDEIYYDAKTVIPLVIRFSFEGYNGEILLVVNLDHQELLDYLDKVYSGLGNWTLMLDNNGREVAVGEEPHARMVLGDTTVVSTIASGQQGIIKRRYGRENFIINYRGMTVAPWKIVNIHSEKVLLKEVNAFGAFLLMLTIASIIVGLVFTLLLSRSVTRPLAILENAIQKVTRRDFDVTFTYPYHDEVGQLGKSFNFMVGEIKRLIQKLNEYIVWLQEEKEKVQNEQNLKRRAELKALQAQINPHFLYNTLESIRWMADKIGAGDISRMTMALSTLFRTGLNQGKEFTTIQDEFENVSSYLAIQKMRYGDRFDYTIDLEPPLRQLWTLKLILQPIIENAIYHGIKERGGSGAIEIRAGLADDSGDIEFLIQDNGPGIHPAKLELISQRLAEGLLVETMLTEGEGYGIYNVNERIRLYFGDRYGLKFTSKWGQGTAVRILIPALRREEISKYV